MVNSATKINPLVKMYCLFYIKKVNYRCNCSFGMSYNVGSQFDFTLAL